MAEASTENGGDNAEFDFKNLKNKFFEQDKKAKKVKKKKKSIKKSGSIKNDTEIAKLKAEIDQLKAANDELKATNDELTQQSESNENDKKISEQKIEELTNENNTLKQTIQDLNNNINELQTELQTAKDTPAVDDTELNELKDENTKLKAENAEMKGTIEYGTGLIQTLEVKNAELQTTVNDLNAQLQQKEELEQKVREMEEQQLHLSNSKSKSNKKRRDSSNKTPKLGNKKSGKKKPAKPAKAKIEIKPGTVIKGKQQKRCINVKHPCIEIDLIGLDADTNEKVLSGTLNFVLFHKERGKSVDNFLALMNCGPKKGNKNLKKKTYIPMSSLFHEIDTTNGIIYGGDVINEDGTGEAISIYGGTFPNDNSKKDCFALAAYSLVWVQNGDDTDANGCQFMILVKPQLQWNLKYVCFGYMVDDQSRQFVHAIYDKALQNRDIIYSIPKKKGVRYPLKNHLSKLGNAIR